MKLFDRQILHPYSNAPIILVKNMISKNWIYSEYNDQSPEAKKLASACGISPFKIEDEYKGRGKFWFKLPTNMISFYISVGSKRELLRYGTIENFLLNIFSRLSSGTFST